MRVAMLMEQLLQDVPGGTGRYTTELAAALTQTAADGDTVTGWIARHGGSALDARQLPLPQQALSRLWALPARIPAPARQALARTGPTGADVIFAPTPFAPPRGATPLVVAVHDAVPWTAPETMSKRGLQWHRQIISRIATDADAILTPTRAVADALLEHVPGLRPGILQVTGEGISAAVAAAPPDAVARAEKLQLPQRFLLMVGTLEPRKGLDIRTPRPGRRAHRRLTPRRDRPAGLG